MAEQDSSAQAPVATVETPATEERIEQSEYFSPEELEGHIRRVVEPLLNNAWSAVDRRITSIEQLPRQLQEIREELVDVAGSSKRANAALDHILKGTATAEEFAQFDEATKRQRAEERLKRTEAEKADLEKRLLMQSQPRDEQKEVGKAFEETYKPLVLRHAKRQGMTYEDIADKLPRELAANTPVAWQSWLEESLTAIDTEADRRHKEQEAKPRVPATRTTPAPEKMTGHDLIKRALANRT